MNSIKNALTRKIGPAPAWIWAAVVGVALYFYRRNAAGASGGGDSGSQQAADTAYYGPYGQDPYNIGGVSGGGGTGGGLGGGDGTIGTNSGSGSAATPPPVINIIPPGSVPTTHAPNKPPIKRLPKPKPGKPKKTKPPKPGKHGRPRSGGGGQNHTRGKPTVISGGTRKGRPRPPARKNPPKTRPKAGKTHY